MGARRPTPPSTRLIDAEDKHLGPLMSWFGTAEGARRWSGPQLRCPFSPTTFRQDIAWSRVDSSALVAEPSGELVGFGQYYEMFQRIHLARLAVAPNQRGRGLESELVRQLISRARGRLGNLESSLYVLESNHSARACYLRAGFVEAPIPDAETRFTAEEVEDVLFMVKPADRSQ